jgi:hypothetical membrane protein
MYFYPGGTPWDPSKIGYTYWENFLSDLGETIAKNGEPNLYSMILSNSAIIVFGISICIFYFNYSTFICKKKWVGWITSGSGILSGGGLILLGITPSNTFKSFHLFGVYLWALGLFCVLLITVIYKNDEYSNYLLSFTTLLLILNSTLKCNSKIGCENSGTAVGFVLFPPTKMRSTNETLQPAHAGTKIHN